MSRKGLCDHSLHLETRLAGGQQAVAGNRKRIGPIRRLSALGKAVYNLARRTKADTQENAGIRRTLQTVRSQRQVPKSVFEPEYFWLTAKSARNQADRRTP